MFVALAEALDIVARRISTEENFAGRYADFRTVLLFWAHVLHTVKYKNDAELRWTGGGGATLVHQFGYALVVVTFVALLSAVVDASDYDEFVVVAADLAFPVAATVADNVATPTV